MSNNNAKVIKHAYGYIPDLPDFRDHVFIPKIEKAAPLQTVLLSAKYKLAPIVDQGQIGSCTGNSSSSAVGFNLLNKHEQSGTPWFQPARLQVYYDGRIPEKSTGSDAGAQIRDVIKGIATYGAAHETLWPYTTSNVTKKPTAKVYADALKFKALSYQRIDNTNKAALVACLVSGYPFVFGFTVYESFESDAVEKSGVVPMPAKTESVLGGHAVLCVGYDAPSDRFIVANSWGTSWGQKGFFTIPAAYLTNTDLASDFWVINTEL